MWPHRKGNSWTRNECSPQPPGHGAKPSEEPSQCASAVATQTLFLRHVSVKRPENPVPNALSSAMLHYPGITRGAPLPQNRGEGQTSQTKRTLTPRDDHGHTERQAAADRSTTPPRKAGIRCSEAVAAVKSPIPYSKGIIREKRKTVPRESRSFGNYTCLKGEEQPSGECFR